MPGAAQTTTLVLFVAFLVAMPVIAAVSQRLRLPYTVALVVAGLLLSALPLRGEVGLSPAIVTTVLLPALVFEAAYRLDIEELRTTYGAIALLAVPGVLITAAIVAVILNATTGLPMAEAFVVGAIVSATDPVAVVQTMRQLAAPRRLVTLVDGESLFNDGTAALVFVIAVGALTSPPDPLGGAIAFLGGIVVSSLIGLAVGFLAVRGLAMTRDHLMELTLTLLAAYGSYLVADLLHLSGIIASVVAAIVLGGLGRRGPMSDRAEEAVDVVWEFLAFLMSAAAFLLIGILIPFSALASAVVQIAWGVAAVLVGRAAVVYLLLGGASRIGGRIGMPTLPLGWLHVIAWAGLRGAVATVLALALPSGTPDRELLQGVVFGIVLFTVVVQGATAGRVVRWAGVVSADPAGAAVSRGTGGRGEETVGR
ncbi:MAG TPA: cation:proton antiporter [Candidatus Limnocylindrales bacterium]